MVRDTSTGSEFERIIESVIRRSCEKNNLVAHSQVTIGNKPGGGKHRIDWEVVDKENENIRGLVSCKSQNTSGTAEEKVAYEVIKILHSMKIDSRYVHAWIILGGTGWSHSMRKFIENDLIEWVPAMKNKVTIYMSTDELMTKGISLKFDLE
jgi:hypothetical protein